MKLQPIWICNKCESVLNYNPDEHYIKFNIDFGFCQGQLSAYYSKDGLKKWIEETIQIYTDKVPNDRSEDPRVELEALLRELEGE